MSDIAAQSPTTVVVFDAHGMVFDRLRQVDLSVALWRVLDTYQVAPTLVIDLSIFAAYATIDWDIVAELPSRAPTLVITTRFQRGEAEEALRREFIGYLDAALPQSAFDRAVRGALLRGEPVFPRELLGAWIRERNGLAHVDSESALRLTPRQRQILVLIAKGATDKEIGGTLGIATGTAQKHVSNLLRRLGVSNRAAAVGVSDGLTRADSASNRVAERGGARSSSVVGIAELRGKHTSRRAS